VCADAARFWMHSGVRKAFHGFSLILHCYPAATEAVARDLIFQYCNSGHHRPCAYCIVQLCIRIMLS
jgi:hypothetical protein